MSASRTAGQGLRVAVVGYGIAGIAAAIALRAGGHHVEHFEAYPRLSAAGGGLLLQPAAIALLSQLGLSADVALVGAHVRQVRAESATGRRLMCIGYPSDDDAPCAIGIERRTLFTLLQRADAASNQVRLGSRIVQVDPEHGHLTDTDGVRFGPYDLIVGADGAKSALRRSQSPWRSREHLYPWAAVVGIVEIAGDRLPTHLQQVFHATHHLSTWPVAAVDAAGRARISVAINVPRAHLPDGGAAALWAARVASLPAAHRLWTTVEAAAADVHAFDYRAVHLRSHASGRLVLIGDAAHAASPQLGHGVTTALEDAACLAACMHGQSAPNVGSALEAYQRKRAPRLRRYQRISALATPLFQSDSRALAWLRDRALLPLMALGPVQRGVTRLLIAA